MVRLIADTTATIIAATTAMAGKVVELNPGTFDKVRHRTGPDRTGRDRMGSGRERKGGS